MSSSALTAWHGARADRVAQLLAAHQAVGGSGPGRRTTTEQINWALTLRLAGEFQGFARDLHDLAVNRLVQQMAPSNPQLASMIQQNLTRNRDLDRGNAHPGSLGQDFNRLGFLLWPALEVSDGRARRWNKDLAALNAARNAIAHAEYGKLRKLAHDGYPPVLRSVKQWQSSLNGLTACMDRVVGASLAQLLGAPAPW